MNTMTTQDFVCHVYNNNQQYLKIGNIADYGLHPSEITSFLNAAVNRESVKAVFAFPDMVINGVEYTFIRLECRDCGIRENYYFTGHRPMNSREVLSLSAQKFLNKKYGDEIRKTLNKDMISMRLDAIADTTINDAKHHLENAINNCNKALALLNSLTKNT